MKLVVEVKEQEDKTQKFDAGMGVAMVTPEIDEDYWLFRVKVSDKQAIVGFPKFCTVGIGFQAEEDWNTNLPYTCKAEEIMDHIGHNKGDASIPAELCVEAIRMIQPLAAQYLEQPRNTEDDDED